MAWGALTRSEERRGGKECLALGAFRLCAEFDKVHEGRGDLFIRRWEATIIPKLKAVAVLEKGDVASLIEEVEDQTEGIRFHMHMKS